MLTVVTGCMFSGKTEFLLSLARKSIYRKIPIILIKPQLDTRDLNIKTHYGDEFKNSGELTTLLSLPSLLFLRENPPPNNTCLLIDEFQFFKKVDLDIVLELNKQDISIHVFGLALDSRGEDFGHMPSLMARADKIIMLHAYCAVCDDRATRTQRKRNVGDTILIGGSESYEPRCIKCWQPM